MSWWPVGPQLLCLKLEALDLRSEFLNGSPVRRNIGLRGGGVGEGARARMVGALLLVAKSLQLVSPPSRLASSAGVWAGGCGRMLSPTACPSLREYTGFLRSKLT